MEVKKNPKNDVNQNKGLYFVIGLVLILTLTYTALEWKTYDLNPEYFSELDIPDELTEEVPITMHIKTLPPPPPVAPPVIEIIEDDDKKIETEILSTEVDQTTEILDVEDIDVIDEPDDTPVPFSVIEDVPVFPGCENEKDKRACFQTMMNKHIKKVFRYPELEKEMGIQGRVNIMFEIQKDGSIDNIRMRGPNKNLEKEAKRIIEKLPRMTPGKQRGRAVKVPFSLPINFKLQ
ncbi:energy transducer TonB [Costertonia aggregata]|uniref:Energy transducer TonB n=1 Tax=Costertonia aggregata TaxID=343403 RepID=A0A7H9ALZ6_9FLAO|nr:energy transducer TonB [Costertonia aggregata]QLG44469.1 energy transducer TonB [Costertonia aggregata]